MPPAKPAFRTRSRSRPRRGGCADGPRLPPAARLLATGLASPKFCAAIRAVSTARSINLHFTALARSSDRPCFEPPLPTVLVWPLRCGFRSARVRPGFSRRKLARPVQRAGGTALELCAACVERHILERRHHAAIGLPGFQLGRLLLEPACALLGTLRRLPGLLHGRQLLLGQSACGFSLGPTSCALSKLAGASIGAPTLSACTIATWADACSAESRRPRPA